MGVFNVMIGPDPVLILAATTRFCKENCLPKDMSSSSTSEKDLRSLDEDSGHDSAIGDDVYSSPAEDRERIENLETVVTWIRQEVVSRLISQDAAEFTFARPTSSFVLYKVNSLSRFR